MTNKEAIKIITEERDDYEEHGLSDDKDNLVEALSLAIKALEREETCENKDCGTEMIFECSVCGASTIDRLNLEDGDFNFCPNCGRKVEK